MIDRLTLPDQVGRAALAMAAAAWVGIAAAPAVWLVAAVIGALLVAGVWRSSYLAFALVVGVVVGAGSGAMANAWASDVGLTDGPIVTLGRVGSDPVDGQFLLEPQAVRLGDEWVRWAGPRVAVTLDGPPGRLAAGESVIVTGRLSSTGGRIAGRPFQGRLRARKVEAVQGAEGPLTVTANLLRDRVSNGLARWEDHPGAALVSGFLIGDIRQLSDVDYDVLRRAGLTHFVAVSGSNVALFLGLWWLVIGPLGGGPRRRAIFGLVGLGVFVVVTRWEPSVLRAAVMAGIFLVSRAAGLPLSGWSALGLSVFGLLVWSAEMAGSVGFQLSVAATLGVLASSRAFPKIRPAFLGSAISVTMGAQLAVAPLLLYHFGSVPVLSPIANVVAAPLVAAATATGGVGVLVGAEWVTRLAVGLASVVLAIAHAAADWPQVGWVGFGVMMIGLWVLRYRVFRPAVLVAVALFLVINASHGGRPDGAAVVFLDVGQGDAILVFGSGGEVILLDGGPDPPELMAGLRRYDVDHIDLLILSHPHADHLAGFLGVIERFEVGSFWHSGSPESGPQFDQLEEVLSAKGVPISIPPSRGRFGLGDVQIEVFGPLRRYDNLNDQSMVLRLTVAGTSILLAGDAEALAQHELGGIPSDILKVPHHGSATNDPNWLLASRATTAVIMVGENSFGHPDPLVLQTLMGAGMKVWRTDLDGDVVIRLPSQESRP